jgi:hypothetical protein
MLSQTACGGRLGEDVGRVVDFLGRKGAKCLASKRGPIVLIAKVLRTELSDCCYYEEEEDQRTGSVVSG